MDIKDKEPKVAMCKSEKHFSLALHSPLSPLDKTDSTSRESSKTISKKNKIMNPQFKTTDMNL